MLDSRRGAIALANAKAAIGGALVKPFLTAQKHDDDGDDCAALTSVTTCSVSPSLTCSSSATSLGRTRPGGLPILGSLTVAAKGKTRR